MAHITVVAPHTMGLCPTSNGVEAIRETYLTVKREECDPKRFGTESHFLYWLKGILNAAPYNMDLIKKRMWKDGHMVDDTQQYLRFRTGTKQKHYLLYDMHWAITGLNDDWNTYGVVTLGLEIDE